MCFSNSHGHAHGAAEFCSAGVESDSKEEFMISNRSTWAIKASESVSAGEVGPRLYFFYELAIGVELV